MRILNVAQPALFVVSGAAILAGCAAHVVPAPVVQTSPISARLEAGVVVSVRPIDPSENIAITSAILSRLGQTANLTSAQNSVEIVIRRRDDTVTSIVQQQRPDQASFTPGEAVTIVEAATTSVRPD